MKKRILEAIDEGREETGEKLRLIMRASRVHFSTIDALFHRFLSTEAYVPQVADEHETALITATPTSASSAIRGFWPTWNPS